LSRRVFKLHHRSRQPEHRNCNSQSMANEAANAVSQTGPSELTFGTASRKSSFHPELAYNNACRTAGPLHNRHASGKSDGLQPFQRILIAGRNCAISDHDVQQEHRIDRALRRRLERHGHHQLAASALGAKGQAQNNSLCSEPNIAGRTNRCPISKKAVRNASAAFRIMGTSHSLFRIAFRTTNR
jgi:hypothetical protein